MNPTPSSPPTPKSAPPAKPPVSAAGAKKSKNLDLKEILLALKKYRRKFTAHLSFVVIMLVLAAYMFVVWQIRGLVSAEPSPEAESAAVTSANIPKIDKAAIDKIQSLEQNSPAVQALFNEARNNPFHE